LKCSVCAQDVPEDRYSEHLESEHGVTDDPTAVLIQHLTGLRSTAGEGDGDGDEGLPDEEPSDADAFEQFLAAHPAEPEGDEEPAEPAATAEPEADTKPEPEPEKEPAPDEAAEPAAATEAAADSDDKTFAVWDEARGAAPAAAAGASAADEDVVVVAPPPEAERARRRRQAALLGLGAAIILVAIAVIYLLTRSTGTKNTTATAPLTTAPPTSPAPTFLPGAQGGAPTTVVAPTTTTPAAATATPATTAAPTPTTTAGNPASKIVFSYSGAQCTPSGELTVFGTITNTNPATYTFSYAIVLVRGDGTQQGTANGSVSHLPPGGRSGPGAIGSGTCTYPLASGPNPRQNITSITPG